MKEFENWALSSLICCLRMPKIRAFKIWYSDKTFDFTQAVAKDVFGAWKEAPDQDVQVAVFYFDANDELERPTRRIMKGEDFYAMDEIENLSEHFDDVTKVSGIVKYGKFTDWDNLVRIDADAFNDYGEGWLWQKPEPLPIPEKQRLIDI